MAGLSPAEQAFFASGDASVLDPANTPAPAPAPDAINPVDAAALASAAPTPAPAPAPAATPAPAPAPAPATDERLDFLTRAVAQSQQQVAALTAVLQNAAQPQPPAEPPAPNPQEDPVGAMMHNLQTLQKQINALSQVVQTQSVQSTHQQQLQAFQAQVTTLRQQFAAATPDYEQALTHLRQVRVHDLRAFGATDQQIAQTIAREELAISEAAIMQGRNPAAVVYEMAKRHGYTPAPTSTPAPAPAPATASLEQIARAQAAAPQLPAGTPDNEITLDSLKGASEADLNRIALNPALWDKMGGRDRFPI